MWADSRIQAGQQWREEINSALRRAAVAVLLVSADFLASDFITNDELPPLLAAAQAEGVRIIPVILKPCAFVNVAELARFQALNDPRQPVISLDESAQEDLWYKVAVAVREALAAAAPRLATQPVEKASRASDRDGQQVSAAAKPDDSRFTTLLAGGPQAVDGYFVYQYHFVDDLTPMYDAESTLADYGADEFIERVRWRFLDGGWEGDGRVQFFWLPPFVGVGPEDTYGVYVWHVKQDNNGTSFFASPYPLKFERLRWHNDE